MAKVFLVANHPFTLSNFRAHLINQIADMGHELYALFPHEAEDPYVAKQFKDLPIKIIPIPLSRRGLNPVVDFMTFVRLYWLYRKERPDIVLNFTIKPNIYSGLAAVWAGIPKVYSNITGLGFLFTDFEGPGPAKRLVRAVVCRLYKGSLSRQTGIFFQNKDDRNFFIAKKIVPTSKALLINGSGVDLSFFAPLEGQPKLEKSFIFVGRLLRDKGVQELVEASRVLARRGHKFNMTIVGGLDQNPSSIGRQEIEAWKKEGIIQYRGHLDDVRDELSKAQVMILPSYREGTPRSVLEAMAMGLAIITTDVPGCRETVNHGENGFLVPPKDAGALAATMEKFIEDPEMAVRMGAESRAFVRKKFDVKKINHDITNALFP